MAAPTVVRVQAGQVAAGTTVNTGTITGNTTGNGLFLALSPRLGPTTTGFGSVTDNVGHTWEQVGFVGISGVTENAHLFWLPVTTGSVTQINWTNPSSVVSSWMLVEVDDHDQGPKSLALFKPGPDSGVNTTMDLGAFTPPVNDALVIAGYFTNDNQIATAVDDGFTLQVTDDQSGASLQGYGIATKQMSGGGVCQPDFTMSGNADGTGFMVAIAPTGAYSSDAIGNTRMGYRNGTTSGWLARPGFSYGGDDYLCLAGTDNKLHMYVSDDLGASWSELDAANAPAHADDTYSYNGRLPISGTGITDFYYAIRRPAQNTIRVRRFDLASGVWESTDIGNADASTVAHSDFTIDLDVRSDGDVVIYYRDSSDDDLKYVRYEGSGWSGAVTVNATNTSILLGIVRTDSSDQIHAFFVEQTNNDLTYRGLDSSNTQSTLTDLDATISTTDLYGMQPAYLNDAGTHRVAWMRIDSDNSTVVQYATAPPANTGTALQLASNAQAYQMGNMGGGLVYYDSWLVPVWSVSGTGKIAWAPSDDIASPSWGGQQAANLVVKGLSVNDVPCSPYESADGLAVAYSEGTDTRIAWVYNNTVPPAVGGGPTTVTPPTATATGSANSPTVKITMLPLVATATGKMPNAPTPTVTVRIVVTPPTATATGQANLPILVGENLTRVTPPTAEATGQAHSPTIRIVATPLVAEATGLANAPTISIRAAPPVATATGQANTPTVKVLLSPLVATATGQANSPTVRVVLKPVSATATGQAHNPLVVIQLPPSTFISGSHFMAYALSGDALVPVAVILIPGSPMMEHAVGGGDLIVPRWGGASYTTVSLEGASIVESD